jgi:hypothetical protein
VIQELQQIILKKDSKKYIGGPFEKLILVIPIDEPALTSQRLKPVLDEHIFERPRQLQEAYLLFSYSPETRNYPYIQLKLTANEALKSAS